MVAGGGLLVLAGTLSGELAHLDLGHATTRSLFGFLYLVSFGSLVGYTAYTWLLANAPLGTVSKKLPPGSTASVTPSV